MKLKAKLGSLFALVTVLSLLMAACAPAAAPQAPAAPPTATPGIVAIQKAEQAQTELEGEIVISIQSSDVQTYQALADAYMKLHPKVKVLVELRPPGGEDSYLQWVRTQFAAGTPRVSVLENPHFLDLIQEGRILNWGPYMNKVNPYTGKKWEESFEPWALNLTRDLTTGELYYLPYMSNQTFWVYNKDAFKKAGITDVPPQPTWDQFVDWCKKLKAAGYICVAQEGVTDRIWGGGKLPWLMRSAMDQYRRSDVQLARCQPGDWCYQEALDSKWKYDPTDPRNDDPDRVSVNVVRHLAALKEKKITFDNECTAEMMDQIGRVFKIENGFVPEGFLGLKDSYPLFLTGKAAMRQDTGRIFTQFEKDVKALAEGAYPDASAVSSDQAKVATAFEIGTFAFPSIEGKCVQAKARANELPSGYLAIPKKDRKQNDLEVDFVMFWVSPAGMKIYLANKLDPKNLQGGIQGPTIVKGVELPDKWQRIFGSQPFIGNYEKPGAPADKVARGFWFYEPTKREWAIMVQDFFAGKLTSKDFATKYQKLLEDNWDGLLKYLNFTAEDIQHPEKRPPGWVAGGPY